MSVTGKLTRPSPILSITIRCTHPIRVVLRRHPITSLSWQRFVDLSTDLGLLPVH